MQKLRRIEAKVSQKSSEMGTEMCTVMCTDPFDQKSAILGTLLDLGFL